MSAVGGLLRRLRWRASRWSADADREFHDALFSPQQYDPFTFAYPGYVTIRRFAELAAARLRPNGVRRAADLGCGPGEITCELARSHPDISFIGIDHSPVAVDRAREHAARLGLTNTTFQTGDISTSSHDADIVLMFDAFHHLLDPAAFVSNSTVDRFLLVEPAGTWLGGWQRTLDLDWLAGALDDIRARLLWEAGETPAPREPSPAAESVGEAVEHRYPLEEFKRFFAGFGLDVRGTAAGFDRYPPDPHGRPPLREAFGRATYDALVAVEDALYARDLDLHAKHWVIYAERGAPDRLRTPAPLARTGDAPRLEGSHDVDYLALDAPAEAAAGTTIACTLTLRNRGWRTLRSADLSGPPGASGAESRQHETPHSGAIFASYHWLDARATAVVQDGARSPLPRPLAPGGECVMSLRVDTPPSPGRYTLAVDLVEEGVTWFSDAGAPMLRRAVRVS